VSRLPDETTILRFRHLVEAHDLAIDMLRIGTAVGATLIAPSNL
jgi:IS5 family transposase